MKDFDKKKVTVIIIFIALIVSGILIKKGVDTFFDDRAESQKVTKKIKEDTKNSSDYIDTKKEKDEDIKEKGSTDKTKVDDKYYDYTVDDSLKLDIPSEVMNYVPKKEFIKTLKGFLKENMLMTENTKVTNDGIVTINYVKNIVSFVISINNSRNTSVTVVIKDKNKISFLYQ